MKVLVYAFKPYGSYETNITEQVLAHPQFCPRVTKRIFDVEFDYEMFSKTYSDIEPQIILGMGQHPRARKLRNERKAKNIYKTPTGELRPITGTGPQARFASLALPGNRDLTTTYDAGIYVCNFSMYIASEYCNEMGARFGFIHVPRHYPAQLLVSTLNPFLEKISLEAD